MKIFSILRGLLSFQRDSDVPSTNWLDDPYAHPDIEAMSERDRADLPPTHMPASRAMGCPAS